MIPRLVTVCIFLFCGTMTALLVRSVINPRGTGLSEVAPGAAFDLFAAHGTGSDLDIWESNRIIGNCEITPMGPVVRGEDRTKGRVKVKVSLLVLLQQPVMEAGALKLSGEVQLHSDGALDEMHLDLRLLGSRPELSLAIRQPPGQTWPSLNLLRGRKSILTLTPGQEPEGLMGAAVETMLKATGLPLDELRKRTESEGAAATVRSGHFEAGGLRHDGYLLTAGDEAAPHLVLYMANTGELLQIDTPFTGDNQLGLRFLSESLRPADASVPVLDEFLLLNPRAPTP